MAESALIAIDIDLAAVNRKLAESGNLTKKEAKEIERELKRAYSQAARAAEDYAKEAAKSTSKAARDAERAARQAARATEQSFNEQASAVRGLFSAAIGGVGGDLLDLADATDGVSAGMAGLGVALGSLAIAPVVLGGLAQGLQDTAAAGLEARDALEEAGLSVEKLVSPAALAALAEYETQLALTEQATQVLSAEMGGAAARDAQIFADALLAAKQVAADASSAMGGFFATIGELAERSVKYSSVQGYLLITSLEDAGAAAAETKLQVAQLAAEEKRLAEEAAAADQSMADQAAMLQVLGLLSDEDTSSSNRLTAALDRQAQSYERRLSALREQLDAQKENTPATVEHTAAVEEQASAFQALDLNYQSATINAGLTSEAAAGLTEQLYQQQLALVPVGGDPAAGTFIGRFADDLGRAITEQVLLAEAMSPVLSNLQQLAQLEAQQHAQRVGQLRDQRKEAAQTYQDALAEYEASKEGMTETEQAAAEESLRLLEIQTQGQMAAAQAQAAEERKAALEGFKRVKALQVAQATIDSLRNAVALTAAFAFAGPMAPALAAGVAGAQLGTAIALINAQPPPRFHFGTSAAAPQGGPVDIPGRTMPALLEQGEGVVSRRGMATPGAAELVEALNLGTMGTADSAITDLQADMLAQRLNRPYAPSIRGRAVAGTNRFYRGR